MSQQPSSPLVAAILALVRGVVPAALDVYEGEAAQDAAPPFVVFYFDSGAKSPFERNLLNDAPRDLRYQTTCVGASPEQARWVVDKVVAALYGSVPAVSGRQVWPVIEQGTQPMQRDDDATGLFYATSQWLTRSEPI